MIRVLLFILLLAPGTTLAAGGTITGVTAEARDGQVWVGGTLEARFPDEVIDEIRRGVPKDLFFTARLIRRHKRFFDEELSAATVRYTLKYDTLQEHFHILRVAPDGTETEHVADTFEDAQTHVSTLAPVALPMPDQPGRWVHYGAVKAEMRAAKLPLLLGYVFFFFPVLEFDTPWARSAPVELAP